jgi:hypothetical protein
VHEPPEENDPSPVPDELKLTEPVGEDPAPELVSLTVAVQVEDLPTVTELGEHERLVPVGTFQEMVTEAALELGAIETPVAELWM